MISGEQTEQTERKVVKKKHPGETPDETRERVVREKKEREEQMRLKDNLGELKEYGSVYKATNKIDGLVYIGQAMDYIFKNDEWRAFGVENRQLAHASSAKSHDDTPYHKAITEFGIENFEIEVLYHGHLDNLDYMEATMIEKYDSLYPNGYNCDRHDRAHGPKGIARFYAERAEKVRMHAVRTNEVRAYVAIDITMKDESKPPALLRFGMSQGFEFGIAEAEAFLEEFKDTDVEIDICPMTYSDDLILKYQKDIDNLKKEKISYISIGKRRGKRNKLDNRVYDQIALNINFNTDKTRKTKRIGGLTSSLEDSYQIALLFIERLELSPEVKIIDNVKRVITGRQQEAAC